jgi:hypothetical protein
MIYKRKTERETTTKNNDIYIFTSYNRTSSPQGIEDFVILLKHESIKVFQVVCQNKSITAKRYKRFRLLEGNTSSKG